MSRNRKLVFSNHVNNVFTALDFDYDSAKNLMLDLALHRDIFDADGNVVSRQEANDKVREMAMAIFELQPGSRVCPLASLRLLRHQDFAV